MCGISVCIGNEKSADMVLHGLKKLEYRGYDSWGIAVVTEIEKEPFITMKEVGKVNGAKLSMAASMGTNKISIGHTRWATHGGISENNSHPHFDCNKRIAVVHNGIIENYKELKAKLQKDNHKFVSQTDTEVLPHLIGDLMSKQKMTFVEAATEVAKEIEGRSAFVAVDSKSSTVVAARVGNPIIIGVGKAGDFFIGSDVSAFLEFTNKVVYLEDGELAVFDSKKKKPPMFMNLKSGKEITKPIVEINWKVGETDKGKYEHFLEKEIMEQKKTIAAASDQDDKKLIAVAKKLKDAKKIFIVGCGTGNKVCMTAEYLFGKIAGLESKAIVGSEFKNYINQLKEGSVLIAVSQSGETADVIEAMEEAKKKGVKLVSILNVYGSTAMRMSDDYFIVNAGAERAVVSTKATTAQMSVLTLLAYAVAGKLPEGKKLIEKASKDVGAMLDKNYEKEIDKLAKILAGKQSMVLIGRGLNYPMAQEGAIKLQETCYINALGLAGGELKHGPLALIEKGTPCIVFAPDDETKPEMISNAIEVKSRGGYIIGVSPTKNDTFDYWIKVPEAGNASPIANIIPIQMLAYRLAVLQGLNPDYPRNLAKSVTVK